eukprot:5706658-Amphidinium_carterae.1
MRLPTGLVSAPRGMYGSLLGTQTAVDSGSELFTAAPLPHKVSLSAPWADVLSSRRAAALAKWLELLVNFVPHTVFRDERDGTDGCSERLADSIRASLAKKSTGTIGILAGATAK